MTEQQHVGITQQLLDTLLDMGLDSQAHHSKLRSKAKAQTGFIATGEALVDLRKKLQARADERRGGRKHPGYVARRKFTLLGLDYVPGDPVSMDKVRPHTRMLLIKRRMIVAGGAD